jgi:transposase
MAQNFIACDRGQTMLMPPDLSDWVPDDHVVWSILGAVDQVDLSAFYGAYRANGQGRAAYEPSVMVALLIHAYARGNRSSRGIERACREDVTYKLITAMAIPDHSTIAEFRRRHEKAIGELFTAVLALCDEAGLVEVGVISVDGVKIRANASRGANRTYEKLVADILKEAEETDRWEDGLFGEDRGDEPPEHLRTAEGRRTAFEAAKERLAQKAGRGEEPEVARIELDPDRVAAGGGRRGWQRAAHKELMARRELDAKPIAGHELSGCSKRCIDSRRTAKSRSQPTTHTRSGGRSVALAACRVRSSGCRPSRSHRLPSQKA